MTQTGSSSLCLILLQTFSRIQTLSPQKLFLENQTHGKDISLFVEKYCLGKETAQHLEDI